MRTSREFANRKNSKSREKARPRDSVGKNGLPIVAAGFLPRHLPQPGNSQISTCPPPPENQRDPRQEDSQGFDETAGMNPASKLHLDFQSAPDLKRDQSPNVCYLGPVPFPRRPKQAGEPVRA